MYRVICFFSLFLFITTISPLTTQTFAAGAGAITSAANTSIATDTAISTSKSPSVEAKIILQLRNGNLLKINWLSLARAQ